MALYHIFTQNIFLDECTHVFRCQRRLYLLHAHPAVHYEIGTDHKICFCGAEKQNTLSGYVRLACLIPQIRRVGTSIYLCHLFGGAVVGPWDELLKLFIGRLIVKHLSPVVTK
jgi:hypothetical protein